jgi:hypothetical protein
MTNQTTLNQSRLNHKVRRIMQAEKQSGAVRLLSASLALFLIVYGARITQANGEVIMAGKDGPKTSPPAPNPDLKSLDRLVGAWKVSGEAQGEIRYEWMEGGFFLVQHFDLVHGGRRVKGIEVIGRPQRYLQRVGEKNSTDIRSRAYSYLEGLTHDHVYELEGDTLTIWRGEKGSPVHYKGTFSKDGNTLTGAWVYPGGGYKTTANRVR